MEFTVNQKAFARELGAARGAVEKSTSIPVLANVLLEARGDRLFITATNLDLSIRTSCPAHVKTEGSGTLPGRKLGDYIKLLAEGDVHLKWDSSFWAKLRAGRSQARIAGMSRESFPEVPTFAESEQMGKLDGKVLTAMIAATEMAISNEESRFTLNGALMVAGEGGLTMSATDGHRLAYIRTTPEQGAEVDARYRVLIPQKALTELANLASSDTVELGQDQNHLFFRCGDHELCTRKLTGNFPDYERVLPSDPAYREVRLHKEEIREALGRVLQFSDYHSRAVRLRVAKDELQVSSSLPELGESEEGVPIDYSGAAVEIGFNGAYLMDFLRVAPTSHVMFRFKDAEKAGELRPDACTGEYRYVVMPMRVA